jgi:hypothetical protein
MTDTPARVSDDGNRDALLRSGTDRESMVVVPLARSMMVRRVVLRDVGLAMGIIGLLASLSVYSDGERCRRVWLLVECFSHKHWLSVA